MELVKLSGPPYERGRTLGQRFRDTLVEVVEKNQHSLAVILKSKGLAPITEERYYAMVRRGLPFAQEYAPDLVDEVQGMATGAGLPFEAIFGFNYFLDFFDATYPELTNDLLFGCTTLAATNTATVDDGAYIGQNYDLRGLYQKGAIILQLEVAPGLEALIFTIAGLVGCAGMNAAGLGITINNLAPSDSRPGVPYTFVLRKALEQERLSEAMNIISAAHRASGINYLMADSSGEVISLETTARDGDVLYALDGYIGHSNHYVHPRLAATYDAPSRPYNGDSYVRWGRVNKLLKQRYGRIARDDLMDILRDHSNYPHSICRHPLDNLDELRTGNTVSSLLMDLRNLTMWATMANPCQNPYEEFRLTPGKGTSAVAPIVVGTPG